MYWGTWRVNGQLAVSRAIGKSCLFQLTTTKFTIKQKFGHSIKGLVIS